jgi:hypothetical protein
MTDFIQNALLDPEIKKVMRQSLLSPAAAVGAVQAAGVTALEYGSQAAAGPRTTVLTLNRLAVTVADTTPGTQSGGTKIYTFPKCKFTRLGATAKSMTFITADVAGINASVSSRYGVGTTVGTNATLATTEQDIVQVTTFTSSAASGAVNAAAVTGYGIGVFTMLDFTTTSDAFFNISVPGATDIDADCIVYVNGVITINWIGH